MSRNKVLNSDKEVNAFRFNLKEQRCLQKSLCVLDAEALYSLKLIDLDNRSIKVFYKRFKDKVSRIKSHLNADEVETMRDLEARGMMPDINKPVNVGGALRIADAEKRLKISSSNNSRKIKSARPMTRQSAVSRPESIQRPNTTIGTYERKMSSSLNFSIGKTSKGNSTTGIYIGISEPARIVSRAKSSNVPGKQESKSGQYSKRSIDLETTSNSPRSPRISEPDNKPASILVNSVKTLMTKLREEKEQAAQLIPGDNANNHKKMHVRIDTESVSVCPDDGPNSSQSSVDVPDTPIGSRKGALPRRPSLRSNILVLPNDTTGLLGKDGKICKPEDVIVIDEGELDIPDRTILSRVSNVTRNSSTPAGQYSCHSVQDRETPTKSRLDIFSGGDDKIGEFLGEDPYEERRRRLIHEEQEKTEELMEEKDVFMDRLDVYIKTTETQNRKMSVITPSLDIPDSVLRQTRKEAGDRAKARRLKKMQQGMHRSSISEEERRRRVQEMWKDVNRCRYLRVPSDKIDLSGIVTLASEQMKLFNAMRPVGDP